MSKLRTSGNAGRDQYNIAGDGTKLSVDNRVTRQSKRSILIEITIGVVVVVAGGFLLFLFKWN